MKVLLFAGVVAVVVYFTYTKIAAYVEKVRADAAALEAKVKAEVEGAVTKVDAAVVAVEKKV